MILKNKNAIIYGAGGSIGGAVAPAFAREGATVFLCGLSLKSIKTVAKEIISSGGHAETAIVDALDEKAINDYIDAVIKKVGSIDISFNAIALEAIQGTPLVEMSLEDFIKPINIAMKTQYLTATAAARHMIKKGSGVILSITASPAGISWRSVGGFGPACSAIEGFSRNLAAELGHQGIRVICIRSAGSPDSKLFIYAVKKEGTLAKTSLQEMADKTMLGKLPLIADIGNVAAFIVSDQAKGMTGTTVNVTCGTTMD